MEFLARQRSKSPEQLELRADELALVAVARGRRIQSLEEELERLAEEARGLEQSARADTYLAALVLLYGLERHTQSLCHLHLTQAEQTPRQPQARADVNIRGIGPMFFDGAATAPGASPFWRRGACWHVLSPGRDTMSNWVDRFSSAPI